MTLLAFYLVNTHNPTNPPLKEIVQNSWPLLDKSKTTRSLNDVKLIFGQRRNKNLSDQLVRASTKTTDPKEKNTDRNPCKRNKTCRYCPLIDNTGPLVSRNTGRKIQTINVIRTNRCSYHSLPFWDISLT